MHSLFGRNIQDNILIAHEIMISTSHTQTKYGAVAIKINLSKAFDQIEWFLLKWVLLQKNQFPNPRINRIMPFFLAMHFQNTYKR